MVDFRVGGRRSSEEIIFKIIELLLFNNIGKTHLMYKANMSHVQQKHYLEYLQMAGLVYEVDGQLRATRKGLEFYVQRRIQQALVGLK